MHSNDTTTNLLTIDIIGRARDEEEDRIIVQRYFTNIYSFSLWCGYVSGLEIEYGPVPVLHSSQFVQIFAKQPQTY